MMESNNAQWWNQFGRVVEEYEESLFDKPNLSDLSTTPDHHLLIEGPWDAEVGFVTYWLLDPEGQLVATLKSDMHSLHISKNHLLYFSSNEDGSTAVHAMKWSGELKEVLGLLANQEPH